MKIIEMEQSGPDWLQWRMKHRMASETPAITRRSPYMSWVDVRNAKRGVEVTQNVAMAHGKHFEHEARLWAAAETGLLFTPVCAEDGDYAASLDGLDGDYTLEIKCPYKGKNSSAWKAAAQGIIRADHDDQIIHQIAVSGSKKCYYVVYDADTKSGIMLEREPDESAWKSAQAQWDEFWIWQQTDLPDPALNLRDDAEWKEAANMYAAAKRRADSLGRLAEEYRQRLIELSDGRSAMGGGVQLTVYERSGSIDYKLAVSELAKDADLEPYRKAASSETRITLK